MVEGREVAMMGHGKTGGGRGGEGEGGLEHSHDTYITWLAALIIIFNSMTVLLVCFYPELTLTLDLTLVLALLLAFLLSLASC